MRRSIRKLGLLASIGIEKGKPFAPDARMKKILTEAAAVGNATARALTFRPRDKAAYFYRNSAWFTPMPGGSYEFLSQPGVRNLDARVMMHYYATGITPAMVIKMVGVGSQYAVATTDSAGKALDGGKRFTCHLTSRRRTSGRSSRMTTRRARCSRLTRNFPASAARRKTSSSTPTPRSMFGFGPSAPKGHEANWVQTFPAKVGTFSCASTARSSRGSTRLGSPASSSW